MNNITVRQALRDKLAPKRTRPYHYRKGDFLLTASFRDKSITAERIQLVVALVAMFTQHDVARMMGVSVSIVSKCVLINAAKGQP